jgi:hypothetical protein
LSFHEVDFGGREESGVTSPVLVLRRRVVEVLGSGDQSCEEDSVTSAVHSLCDLGETGLESVEVDEGAHESWHLNVGLFDEDRDEGFEGRDRGSLSVESLLLLESGFRRSRRWGRERSCRRGTALDYFDSFFCEVGCATITLFSQFESSDASTESREVTHRSCLG